MVGVVVSGRLQPAPLSLGSRGPPRGAPAVPKEDLDMAGADRKSSSPAPSEEQAAGTVLPLLCWASPLCSHHARTKRVLLTVLLETSRLPPKVITSVATHSSTKNLKIMIYHA